ncbi:hypothetical protein FB382_003397 [Nocardioides ginsengisegetis]|uniref:Uncharacterized protein n=1 Tax=Nocardioides ginsengisegetis TaxID=661491 RepID=A0A7W3PB18_9ACTN|nr:hypothetical protein [Nocardioides ginsengisegetis]
MNIELQRNDHHHERTRTDAWGAPGNVGTSVPSQGALA